MNTNSKDDAGDQIEGAENRGYTPPDDAPIPLGTPRPKVKTLDKKKVAIIAAIVVSVIAVAFVVGLTPKAATDDQEDAKEAEPASATNRAEVLNALPGNYADAAKKRAEDVPDGVPLLGPPMPGETGQMQLEAQRAAAQRAGEAPGGQAYGQTGSGFSDPQQSAYLQFQAQQELERLKRAADAKASAPGFGRGPSSVAGTAGAPLPPDQLVGQVGLGQAGAPASAAEDAKAARDDANRQDDKRQFLKGKSASAHTLAQGVNPPASPTVVSAGTLIPALFLTGVNSDLPGMVTAQVSQPVYDTPTGRHLMIPQGAVLIGTYDSRVTVGQSRVLLVWQRLRFPDGSSLNLEGMPGVDMSGYSGVKDRVNNHWGKIITSVVLSSTLSAAVAVAEGDSFSTFQRSAGQAASQGASQAISQTGGEIVDRSLQIQPTLEVRPGQRVGVMVSVDLALSPYAR